MNQLNPHVELLMDEYREHLPLFRQLSQQVYDQLRQVFHEKGIELNSIEFRVKTEASLAGKLERKGDKYKTLSDVTDLVGLRIVTFYTDDVDKVAAIVKRLYTIDWTNSVDKRKLHQLDSFGYNSLHYICHLKKDRSARFLSKYRCAPPCSMCGRPSSMISATRAM